MWIISCPVFFPAIHCTCLSYNVCTFNYFSCLSAISIGGSDGSICGKTRSSENIVLPVDADRTTVVLAQEPAPPHITHTHADCTPTQLDREPATPLLTPTPADRHPVPVDTAPSPPQSTQTRAVSKATAVPKSRGPPLRTRSQRLKQKKNCSQVRFRSYGSYYFALASLYLLIPTNFKFEGCNWNSNGATGMF